MPGGFYGRCAARLGLGAAGCAVTGLCAGVEDGVGAYSLLFASVLGMLTFGFGAMCLLRRVRL